MQKFYFFSICIFKEFPAHFFPMMRFQSFKSLCSRAQLLEFIIFTKVWLYAHVRSNIIYLNERRRACVNFTSYTFMHSIYCIWKKWACCWSKLCAPGKTRQMFVRVFSGKTTYPLLPEPSRNCKANSSMCVCACISKRLVVSEKSSSKIQRKIFCFCFNSSLSLLSPPRHIQAGHGFISVEM